jgi:hypothetical protein
MSSSIQVPSQPSIVAASLPPIGDWGTSLALLIMAAVYLWKAFEKKEEKEAKLTETLIEDLRVASREATARQTKILEEMQSSQLSQQKIIQGLADTTQSLFVNEQQGRRDSAIVLVELRQLQDQIVIVGEKINALHSRLDRSGVPQYSGEN